MKDVPIRDKAMEKLVEKGLRADLKPASPSCLDAEILAAYIDRTLSQRERADCEGHLASCARCQEHVAALVRLSETDEPVQVRAAASAPARAIRPSWFRLLLAGPAFAAALVAGVYFLGPFREINRQAPEINQQTRPSVTLSPPETEKPAQGNDRMSSAPERSKGQAKDAKALYDITQAPVLAEKRTATQPPTTRSEGETTASTQTTIAQNPSGLNTIPPAPPQAKSSGTEAQSVPRNVPTPEPATSERGVAVRSRTIATPSVRAKIAQNFPGESGAAGGSSGTGAVVGGVGGGVSGGLSNNLSRKNSKDEAKAGPPQKQTEAIAKAAKEQADLTKTKTQNEAKADSITTATPAKETRDRERKVPAAAQTVEVTAGTQAVQVESEFSTPTWRVGRHGMIKQKEVNGNWKKHKSGVKTNLNDISFATPDVGWAVGQAGTILRSTDGGNVWIQVPSPTTEDIVHVTAISDLAASIVTRNGGTLTTSDGGKTWSGDSQ